jgi:hypothetical protein
MSDIAGVWTSLTVAGQRSLAAQQQRCFCLAMRDSPHQFPWSSPLMASAGCIPEQSQRLQRGMICTRRRDESAARANPRNTLTTLLSDEQQCRAALL